MCYTSKSREHEKGVIMGRDNETQKELTPRARFLLHMLVGAVIGIGGILPGVSGGVMAVSLGIYVPMIDAIAGFFKAPKKNFLFLLPIGLGAGLGFLLGAVVLKRVMDRWYTEVIWLFIGLVAGGVPSFIKEANERGFKKRYLLATVLGAALALLLLLLKKEEGQIPEVQALTPLMAAVSGAIVSVGTVVPGISTSFILMYLGWYRAMMDAFANLQVLTVLFVCAGAGGFFILTVKAARWLFDRFHGWAYYAVLGFLIVSAALIVPRFTLAWSQLVGIALAVLGAVGSYFLGKISF